MRARRLTVLSPVAAGGDGTFEVGEVGKAASLGVLSVHFEGGRCRVRCPFCYLGQRSGAIDYDGTVHDFAAVEALVLDAVRSLDYRELAVTLSEPVEAVLEPVTRLLAAAKERGRNVAVTTTIDISQKLPASALPGLSRINLSIDPWKGQVDAPSGTVDAQDIAKALSVVRAKWDAERVLIVSLSTPRFADALFDGLLAELLAIPDADRVALNALKPPPAWCDRAFWMRALARLQPLLRQHLDTRLFLDCYVAARILHIGDCPARPDLSPVGPGRNGAGRLAFRSCVYQPAADFVVDAPGQLADRLQNFTVPAVCPFPIR